MKRTLTAAAAIVASSAGAVGFAGTATAVETLPSPADAPVNHLTNFVDDTHGAAKQVVGGVVPLPPAGGGRTSTPPGGPSGPLAEGLNLQDALKKVGLNLPVPGSRSGAPRSLVDDPVGKVVDGLMKSQGVGEPGTTGGHPLQGLLPPQQPAPGGGQGAPPRGELPLVEDLGLMPPKPQHTPAPQHAPAEQQSGPTQGLGSAVKDLVAKAPLGGTLGG